MAVTKIIAQEITEQYALYNGDAVDVLASLPDKSIDLSIYSPPFSGEGRQGGLYHYSSSPRDLSNTKTYAEFLENYEFIITEMARVTKPGRMSAVHCMDVPRDGANICSYTDFPGDIIRLHEKHGFEYTPRIVIWKEPLAVRNRTMSKALAHRQVCEDSTKINVAAADYLIPFRRKGDNKTPVAHPVGLLSYAGERVIPHELQNWKGHEGKQTENRFSHWIWRQYASSIWDDIRIDNVVAFEGAKDPQDERHPHPLQLDVIERAVILWSNPGEVVLTPFMGVGSEAVGAVSNGRKAIGAELKTSYYKQAVRNISGAEKKIGDQMEIPIDAYPPLPIVAGDKSKVEEEVSIW